MADVCDNPGYATDVDLGAHWAVDRRSVPEIARGLGLARRRPGWAWLDVWAAEGVAAAPALHEALRAPMIEAEDVAALIPNGSGAPRSTKTVVRWSETGRHGFPAALRLSYQLRRWWRAEILAWLAEEAPPFPRTPVKRPGPGRGLAREPMPATPTAAPAVRPLFAPRAAPARPENDSSAAAARIAGHNDRQRTK